MYSVHTQSEGRRCADRFDSCWRSMPAVEYTKEFITSVVVGKDVVPRIGLHQLEQLRSDLMDVIKHSKQSKVTGHGARLPLSTSSPARW